MNIICAVFIEGDGDDVKAAVGFLEVLFGHESLGYPPDLLLFLRSYCFFRKAESRALSCLYFDENERISVIGDYVDFSPLEAEVTLDYSVFFLF